MTTFGVAVLAVVVVIMVLVLLFYGWFSLRYPSRPMRRRAPTDGRAVREQRGKHKVYNIGLERDPKIGTLFSISLSIVNR